MSVLFDAAGHLHVLHPLQLHVPIASHHAAVSHAAISQPSPASFPTEDMICDNQEIRNDIVRGWTQAPFKWATPIEGGRGGCAASDISKLVTTMLCLVGSSLIASSIGVVVQAVSAPPGGWYLNLIREEKIKALQAQAEETETWIDDIGIYFKILMSKSWFRALWMILLWIAVGILYGVLSEQKMTFITALYYAVTAVSTAGLEAPKLIQYGKEVRPPKPSTPNPAASTLNPNPSAPKLIQDDKGVCPLHCRTYHNHNRQKC
jgi:hypothetical protein